MNVASPEVSIVLPVFNERDSLRALLDEIRLARSSLPPSEVVFVDDGSTDGGGEILAEVHRADPSIRVVRFTRNFGQTAAIAAGFDYARGRVVVTMDSDGQNDPADIVRLLAKLDEGYDVVSGRRVARADKLVTRRFPSAVANRLISRLAGVRLHDYGCTLKAYRREVVEGLDMLGDAHRFLPALAARIGDRVAEIDVNHRPRTAGESSYGLSRVSKVGLDLLALPFLLRFAQRPMRFFGTVGVVSGLAGGALLSWMAVEKFALGHAIGGRPALLAGVLLALMGVQFVTLGLLGEMIVRSSGGIRGRRTYHVRTAFVDCSPGHHTCRPPAEVRLP
jgi:glycosyltransferase involved in cell wall biosynthesis